MIIISKIVHHVPLLLGKQEVGMVEEIHEVEIVMEEVVAEQHT